ELARHLLADAARVIALVDLEIGLEKAHHRQVGGELAVGYRRRLAREPALGPQRVGEFPEEARLADPGLADQRHHLAVPGPGALQGLAQAVDLTVAAHEGREPARGRGLNARAH